jgi:preprotein translocase subunit SecD
MLAKCLSAIAATTIIPAIILVSSPADAADTLVLAVAGADIGEVFQSTTGPAFQVIDVRLIQRSAENFSEFTERNVGKVMSVLIDGKVTSSPTIRGPIRGGRLEIVTLFDSLISVTKLIDGRSKITVAVKP